MLDILLADDEPTIRLSVGDALRAAGHRVTVAPDVTGFGAGSWGSGTTSPGAYGPGLAAPGDSPGGYPPAA